jgi:biotin operon repressor
LKLPRKPPALTIKTERDRVMNGLGKWTVTPTIACCSYFNSGDPINLARVYLMMASHANRQSRMIRIGQQRIATALGVCRQTVGANIRKLAHRGLIARAYRMPPPHSIIVWRLIDNLNIAPDIPHAYALNRARRAPVALAA